MIRDRRTITRRCHLHDRGLFAVHYDCSATILKFSFPIILESKCQHRNLPLTGTQTSEIIKGINHCIPPFLRYLQARLYSGDVAAATRYHVRKIEVHPAAKEFQDSLSTDQATGEHPLISPPDFPRIYTQVSSCDPVLTQAMQNAFLSRRPPVQASVFFDELLHSGTEAEGTDSPLWRFDPGL